MLQLAPSRALDLSKRGLREIPAELSQVASSLLSLFLSSNQLTSLSLPPLPRLSELHLTDNLLDSRTVQLAPLPHALRVLDLSKNRLLLFPPSLLSLSQLRLLLLSNQQLSSLPPQLSALSQLEVLDASFNEISHALILNAPGLPILRRLLLRGNSLRAVSLDGERLPSLTELDLSDNALDHFPPTLGSLSELKTLSLSNNRLRKLVSEETAPCRRMWVASHGLHQLTQLTQLSLAQNQLIELPLGLQQLAQLLHLDLRCNPLSPEALELASSHCKRVGARLRSTSLPRLYPGLILGDESSAWHKPTLLHARVTHVVSFSSSPPSGVALTRLQAKLPMEVALLGLCDAKGGYTPPLLTAEGLRKAFHAQALRCHPDKQQQSEGAASSLRFAELKAAYTRLCRWMHIEQRRLPVFSSICYHFVELAPLHPTGEGPFAPNAPKHAEEARDAPTCEATCQLPSLSFLEAAAARAIDASAPIPREDMRSPFSSTSTSHEDLAEILVAQLPTTLEFIREAHRVEGEVLLHAGHSQPGLSRAAATFVALAFCISTLGDSYSAAAQRMDATLRYEPLSTPLVRALEAFAANCLHERVGLSRELNKHCTMAANESSASAQEPLMHLAESRVDARSQPTSSDKVPALCSIQEVSSEKDKFGFTAEQASADVEAALADGWTLRRVGKYEVLFAPDAQLKNTREGRHQTFSG
ncbi:MAG: hypothetical protein SGPRY_005393 [Prymnesium sp.]